MKKKMNLLQLCALGFVLAVAVAMSCSLTSCKKAPWNKKSTTLEETIDSLVTSKVKKNINPTFYSVDEVVVYQDLTHDGIVIDSIFNSMPEATLAQVANVLIKRDSSTTKRSIVKEYTAHKDVYPNLLPPEKHSSTPPDTTVEVKGKKGVFSTTYKYRTDTVDGVPVKVQVKEEQSYVE